MKIRYALLIILVFVCTLGISCNAITRDIKIGSAFDESQPVKPADIKQSINKGTLFLINTQNRDGSWGTFESARPGQVYLGTAASHDAFRNASTALCCMALMEVPPELNDNARRMALNKGLRYLMSQKPEGRASSDTLYHIWSLTYVTQCLSRAIKYEYLDIAKDELVTCARKWLWMLQYMQSADGGWAYYDFGYGLRKPSGWHSTSFNTAASLGALWEAEKAGLEINPKVKEAALRCLERLRTPDKSFTYGTYCQQLPAWIVNRPKGALGRSQACNLMLFRYGKIPAADLKLGLDRLFQEHHFIKMGQNRPYPHESWYATAGYYFFFGHFYAAAVINELPFEEQTPYRKALARVLLTCQQKDGSWWDFPLYGYYKSYGTAFALLSLAPVLEGFSNKVPSGKTTEDYQVK
jgi:hypothetical protein